ncbi:hypothetical protein [Noviherbaspirillum sp.]|uniref:hypothetical protein n=1 Tax=Noviherbaspirillum sp. TaxID=1926288 RepID=UPI002FE28A5C
MLLVRWMAIATLAAAHGAVAAQEPSRPLNPADAAGPTAPMKYESAFDNYQQMQEGNEPSIEVWRAANNEMRELGGHAGHIKGIAPAPSAKAESKPAEAAASATPAEKAMPAGHGNHGNHGMDNKTKGK